MEKRLAEIQERAAQLLKELERTDLTQEQLDAIEAEQRELEIEANTIKRKFELNGKLVSMGSGNEENPTRGPDQNEEERAAEIKKTGHVTISSRELQGEIGLTRSTTIATGTLVEPTKSATEIRDNLNPVSSIVDQVATIDATGAIAYEEPYVKSEMEAGEREDGKANANPSDPVFRIAKLTPMLINVTTYVSKNIKRVSPVAYAEKIKQLALKALRRKAAGLIVNGGDGVFGIKTAKNTNNEEIYKELLVNSTAFGPDTLSEIVFSYGGNDELGGNARLFLTKNDLQAFGKVRGKNELKAIYKITPSTSNPNVGTIEQDGLIVPYTLMSGLTSLSTAQQGAEPVQTMLYGDPQNFELALFGDYEVQVYEETKAVEGMFTIIGEVMLGGNIIVDNGFVIVTLKAAE